MAQTDAATRAKLLADLRSANDFLESLGPCSLTEKQCLGWEKEFASVVEGCKELDHDWMAKLPARGSAELLAFQTRWSILFTRFSHTFDAIEAACKGPADFFVVDSRLLGDSLDVVAKALSGLFDLPLALITTRVYGAAPVEKFPDMAPSIRAALLAEAAKQPEKKPEGDQS